MCGDDRKKLWFRGIFERRVAVGIAGGAGLKGFLYGVSGGGAN